VQSESDADVQVGVDAHRAIGVQPVQTRSAVAEQAALWNWPAAHAPEQVLHAPPLRYCPAPQLVHCEAPGPLHVGQLAEQLEQMRSVVVVHTALW
jgi:hypothetical protein